MTESEAKREKDREASDKIVMQLKEQNFQMKKQLEAAEKQLILVKEKILQLNITEAKKKIQRRTTTKSTGRYRDSLFAIKNDYDIQETQKSVSKDKSPGLRQLSVRK